MSNRIRYSKTANSTLVSVRSFLANGNNYKVELHPDRMMFYVTVGGEVVEQGTGVSLANLKIKAKKALTDLGVSFDKETRDKGVSYGQTMKVI